MAQKIPEMPQGYTINPKAVNPAPTTPKSNSQHYVSPPQNHPNLEPNTHVSNANSVKEMQQALINMGKIMSKNYALKMDLSPQEREGAHPFGNFLVNQYINHSKTDNKQFVNTELNQPVREQSSIHDKEFRGLQGLVNNLSQIGTPGVGKGERSPDGIWQGRTDHALNTALTIGNALLQLSKDMQVKVEGFSDKDVAELTKLIPQKYTQLKNSSEAAEQIIPYLNKIGVFYHSFEKAILNNDQYKSLITQEKPFASQNKIEDLNKDEEDLLSKNLNVPIPNANFNGKPITLQNISSMDEFKKFLTSNNIQVTNSELVKKYTNLVKNLIETGGAGY